MLKSRNESGVPPPACRDVPGFIEVSTVPCVMQRCADGTQPANKTHCVACAPGSAGPWEACQVGECDPSTLLCDCSCQGPVLIHCPPPPPPPLQVPTAPETARTLSPTRSGQPRSPTHAGVQLKSPASTPGMAIEWMVSAMLFSMEALFPLMPIPVSKYEETMSSLG